MTEAKFKHLDYIQAAIGRMATNSFLFKGWAVTLAAGLSAFAAVNTKTALLSIALVSTVMFWALDGYYLWLERGFVELHKKVAAKADADIYFLDDDRQAGCCAAVVQDLPASAPVVVLRVDHRDRRHRHLRYREQVMARRVFFSFKYQDVGRAMIVRNSWVTQTREAAGFIDAAAFETLKQIGDPAIQRWIDAQLGGTSVTVVLVGAKTCTSRCVRYEIEQVMG